MNKHKITLVVEGLAERIFVRRLLLTWFEYDPNRIGCDIYCLHADRLTCVSGTNVSYGSQESEYYFQIIDACNDAQVLSAILRRAKGFINAGYELIVGLRDMYSEEYKAIEKRRIINPDVCERFVSVSKEIISHSGYEGTAHVCFAIMEVEAWFLALQCVHEYVGIGDVNNVQIDEEHTIAILDPETQFYHPTQTLTQILEKYGKTYDKHEGEIEALLSNMKKEDIEALYQSTMCASFKNFLKTLISEELSSKEV